MGRREKNNQFLEAGTGSTGENCRVDGEERDRHNTRSTTRKNLGTSEGTISGELKVNPLALPSLPLSWRKAFPKKASVIYFALSENDELLYIGRAINLYLRWNGCVHQYQKTLEQKGGVRIAWMEVGDVKSLPKIEYALIEHFRPPLNKVNNALAACKVDIKEKTFKIRLSTRDWERLHDEAARREVPASQVIRDFLKTLDNTTEPVQRA